MSGFFYFLRNCIFIVPFHKESFQMKSIKERFYEIIFEADTKGGKVFDIILLVIILISVVLVMLESVESIGKEYGKFLKISEWIITIIFTIEYIFPDINRKKTMEIHHQFLWHYRFVGGHPNLFKFNTGWRAKPGCYSHTKVTSRIPDTETHKVFQCRSKFGESIMGKPGKNQCISIFCFLRLSSS